MSDEPDAKRSKMSSKKRFFPQNRARNFIEPGIKGFLATCNFREKDCVRECYNLLNDFADQESTNEKAEIATTDAIDENDADHTVSESAKNESANSESEEEEDISTQLQNQIATINSQQKERKRFQQVETKVANCIFIKTTVADPTELAVRIMRAIGEHKRRSTRFLLRLIPVITVCKANVTDIKNTAGKLFDNFFLNKPPTTFSIVVNKRFNNDLDRMAIINELATIISFKDSKHKVDLKHAQLTILIEVVKGLCCISVLPDYTALKKYNVFELAKVPEADDESVTSSSKLSEATDGAGATDNTSAKEDEAAKPVLQECDTVSSTQETTNA